MAAARRENLHRGHSKCSNLSISQADAAKQFEISRTTVQSATTVVTSGLRELIDVVDHGDMAVSLAAKAVLKTCH